jgi:hypothetical protein
MSWHNILGFEAWWIGGLTDGGKNAIMMAKKERGGRSGVMGHAFSAMKAFPSVL